MPVLIRFATWVPNEIWMIDLSLWLGRFVYEFIQIISFFRTKLIYTVIGIVLCHSHQAYCLLYYLCEISINSGINIY